VVSCVVSLVDRVAVVTAVLATQVNGCATRSSLDTRVVSRFMLPAAACKSSQCSCWAAAACAVPVSGLWTPCLQDFGSCLTAG
jgi:hypothetical protein